MRNQRGQSTLEIAILMAVVIGALLAMQVYMRRGTMGKLREMSDQVGEQYEPTGASYTMTKGYLGARTEETDPTGGMATVFAETKGSFREAGEETTVGRDLGAETLYQ